MCIDVEVFFFKSDGSQVYIFQEEFVEGFFGEFDYFKGEKFKDFDIGVF